MRPVQVLLYCCVGASAPLWGKSATKMSSALPGFSTPPEYATVVLSSVCPVRVLTTVTRSDHDPTAVAALPVFLSCQLIVSEPPDCGDDGLTPSPITWRSAARTSTCWG